MANRKSTKLQIKSFQILANASKHTRTRQNLESICIALLGPNLNDHLKSNKLPLFINGITCKYNDVTYILQNNKTSWVLKSHFLLSYDYKYPHNYHCNLIFCCTGPTDSKFLANQNNTDFTYKHFCYHSWLFLFRLQ